MEYSAATGTLDQPGVDVMNYSPFCEVFFKIDNFTFALAFKKKKSEVLCIALAKNITLCVRH